MPTRTPQPVAGCNRAGRTATVVAIDEDFHVCPLWTFSLAHYAKPGVRTACLALQDQHGLDVNVALACLWHERRGGSPLSGEDIEAVLAAVEPARVRAWAIRRLRRAAKDARHADALYRALKRAELLAENLLQRTLYETLASRASGSVGDGRQSLLAYALHMKQTLPPEQVEAFVAG